LKVRVPVVNLPLETVDGIVDGIVDEIVVGIVLVVQSGVPGFDAVDVLLGGQGRPAASMASWHFLR